MTDIVDPISTNIDIPTDKIRVFCKQKHIRLLALFGSVIRGDFNEDSDIDVLVEFEPDQIPGFQFFAIQEELARILGRKVDLNTSGFLSPYMRANVLREAVILYDQT